MRSNGQAFKAGTHETFLFPGKWVPAFVIQKFQATVENRFQGNIRIKIIGSEPVAIEER